MALGGEGFWEQGYLLQDNCKFNLEVKPNRNSQGGCPALEELPRAPGEMVRSGVFQKGLFNSPLGEIIQGVGYTMRGCGNPWITTLESSPCTNCLEQASLCI